MSFTCFQDNTSDIKQVSSEYEKYIPTDLDDFFEFPPNGNIEQIDVDITTATGVIMDTLDISDNENYLSCNKEMAEVDLNNSQENDGRIDPREFMPVPSMEFERLCLVVIDGDTLES